MKLGILSTARINEMILRGAARTNHIEVRSVASRDVTRAAEYARSHNIPQSFGNYEDLLSDPDTDAVYISLPNSLHTYWSVRALKAGKHVLCEKPLTRDVAEATHAFEVAKQVDRVLLEGFMYQHHPQTVRLVEMVRSQAIGKVRAVRSCFRWTTSDETDIRLNPQMGGGSLMDLGCYCVHAARMLLGEPERVYAEQLVGRTGVDTALQALMVFPDGVVAQFDSSFVALPSQELEVVGSGGSVRVSSPFRTDLGPTGLKFCLDATTELVNFDEADSYAMELTYFADMVQHNNPLERSADHSIGQARALAALYQSASRHLPVKL